MDAGQTGLTGATGLTGTTGLTGLTGLTGTTGTTGLTGLTGGCQIATFRAFSRYEGLQPFLASRDAQHLMDITHRMSVHMC